MSESESVLSAFAPNGAMRVAINVGNPILAARNDGHAIPAKGVSVDLATALAAQLGVAAQFLVFDTAAQCVEALGSGGVDIGFFAIDPVRGAGVNFSAPYVLIEGAYAVRTDSTIIENSQVDAAGNSVVVGAGSAYDLFLTRSLKNATIVRAANSPAVVPTFLSQNLDVAAGVKQQLETDAARVGGIRLLPGRFMVIEQAMGISKSRGELAHRYLSDFVESKKASGWVLDALRRHGIQGASVAPKTVV
ncbi:MAG: ABC transporter substrate-binding protein [Betaproteobacteria bacterium]|nr:MAG: ABC transporter substrate-binding protein [Betaproteobacteria bacterium]TAG76973.1 MAG: ABC transporter substrate-binding protein [Betaproteobacteria bacterium]